jgi:hypothetical protein
MRRRVARYEGRRAAARNQGPSILIVCEGEQTERLYFEGFKVPSATVVGTGFNTVTLVKEAIRLNSTIPYDQVWCVFDKDSFSARDFQEAIDLARRNGFHPAYTNEAFELWYLLHFDYHDAALSRRQYGDKLSEKLGRRYEKNDPEVFSLLLARQDEAIRNAEKLLAYYDPHVPHENNPCTTVQLLVQVLRRFRQNT